MTRVIATIALAVVVASPASAAGHGPVFGAATPTLGRGGWSLDEAWTFRSADGSRDDQMLRTMVSFGVTENLQVSGSVPVAIAAAASMSGRMMSMMSSDREIEGLLAYRFQRRAIGIGARQESTLYVGGTAPTESRRNGMAIGPSVEAQIATGYASRAHYVWVGGGIQHYADRAGARPGDSRLLTFVYGYRPGFLRTEARKPDLRFFVEATAEDRGVRRVGGLDAGNGGRTVFVGPTTLLLHRAFGIEGGVLFPAYQRVDNGGIKEHVRVAIDVAYFFWLK